MKNFTLVAENQDPGVKVVVFCEQCGDPFFQRLQRTGHLQIDVDDITDANSKHVCEQQ